MPPEIQTPDCLDRRGFLAGLLRGGLAASALSLVREALPDAERERRRASEPAPAALAFARGRVAPGGETPFASTSTEAILGRLEKAEPSHAKQLLSILANSTILDDPPLEKLSPYLGHRDPDIVSGALEVIAKRKRLSVDEASLAKFLNDERDRVRLAAVDLLAEREDLSVDGKRLSELHRLSPGGRVASALHLDAILDLVSVRKPESAEAYLASKHGARCEGNLPMAIADAKRSNFSRLDELELVRAAEDLSPNALLRGAELRLARCLLEKIDSKGTASRDAMPLLYLLRSIDESFPGYLDEVNREPGRFAALGEELLRAIRKERESEVVSSRALMRREAHILVGLHDDFTSWPERSEDRIRAMMRPARLASVEVIYPPLAEGRIQSPKSSYLEALAKVVADPGKLAVVWNTGHGGPRHFWFVAGGLGEHLSENLAHESGVSHEELSKTLVEACAKDRKVDLSHVILIQDACFQLDFALNLYESIFEAARTGSLEVEGLPRVVSAPQRGLPSWIARSHAAQIEEGASERLPFTMREPGSFLQNAFRETAKKDGSLLERILLADEMLGGELEKELESPEGDLSGQDLAVFSPRVVDLAGMLADASERLAARRIELPEIPERRAAPRAIQIARARRFEGDELA